MESFEVLFWEYQFKVPAISVLVNSSLNFGSEPANNKLASIKRLISNPLNHYLESHPNTKMWSCQYLLGNNYLFARHFKNLSYPK